MTSGYTEFTDVTGASSAKDPLVRGSLIAAYLTGSGIVPWTAAELQARLTGGEGVVGIDQTPGGRLFAANGEVGGIRAAVYDVEYQAGTPASAALACHARAAAGVRQHTLYVSLSALPGLRAAVAGIPGVCYGVANYSWSLAEAEAYIAANPDVAYVQFGDPNSNPLTDIPGTTVTLMQADADIDVARASWAAQFIPGKESAMASMPGKWSYITNVEHQDSGDIIVSGVAGPDPVGEIGVFSITWSAASGTWSAPVEIGTAVPYGTK